MIYVSQIPFPERRFSRRLTERALALEAGVRPSSSAGQEQLAAHTAAVFARCKISSTSRASSVSSEGGPHLREPVRWRHKCSVCIKLLSE
ncbi:hypothetical protein Baya_4855 [Bagarius yarrelli]|uniref:Uncharacterized protein n=1 Tax=Bagarius yarrelli TaxID=175774 RepID=A0A556TRR6_BAGYA|nr:hypothetical protein Baya_4855 [Bagarius yarrelli]